MERIKKCLLILKKSKYSLPVFLIIVLIFFILMFVPISRDDLKTSFLKHSNLYQSMDELERAEILSGDFITTALPIISNSELFKEYNQIGKMVSEWIELWEDKDISTSFLLLKGKDNKDYIASVELDPNGAKVKKVNDYVQIFYKPMEKFFNIQSFFKSISLPYKEVSTSRLKSALQNKKSIENIKNAISLSFAKKTSEVGGLMFLNTDENYRKPEIVLKLVPGRDEGFVDQIIANQNNTNEILRLLRDNKDKFDFVKYDYEALMRAMQQNIPPEQRRRRLEMFLDLYLFMSRQTYQGSLEHIILIASEPLPGKFVGHFHIHPLNNLPSYEDKMVSKFERVLVIVPLENGFDIYDLFPGKSLLPEEEKISYRQR